jgi:hypothetical protein
MHPSRSKSLHYHLSFGHWNICLNQDPFSWHRVNHPFP